MTDQPVSFRSLAFLVAANHEFTRDLLHFALEAFQAEDIQDAASVPEVLQALGTLVPDIVLMEMSLQPDGGTGVVHPLQTIGKHLRPTTAVLAFTGRPLEIDILRAIRSGADDVLRWPFSAHFLSQRIARALIHRNSGLKPPYPASYLDPLKKPNHRSPEWPNVAEVVVRAYQRVTLTPDEIRALTTNA